MRKSLITMALLISSSTFAAGGHDVGNAGTNSRKLDLTSYKEEVLKGYELKDSLQNVTTFLKNNVFSQTTQDGIRCSGTYSLNRVWIDNSMASIKLNYLHCSAPTELQKAELFVPNTITIASQKAEDEGPTEGGIELTTESGIIQSDSSFRLEKSR